MNRDYVDEQITAIVDQMDDLWARVYDLSVEMQVHGYGEAEIDLDLHEITMKLNEMSAKLWTDKRQTVLDRYFPVGRDPDRLREDAEDCARP